MQSSRKSIRAQFAALLFGFCASLCVSAAQAECVDCVNCTIKTITPHDSGNHEIWFTGLTGQAPSCSAGGSTASILINDSKPGGRGIYGTLLAAKMAGKPIAKVRACECLTEWGIVRPTITWMTVN